VLTTEMIRARIAEGLPGAEIELRDTTGTGDHFDCRVVAEAFAGLTMIQQHQKVYATLKDWLATGELHALALKTYTPAAWAAAGARSR
jgi:acid stress-induced BolA-like protein IbaG/YrbA